MVLRSVQSFDPSRVLMICVYGNDVLSFLARLLYYEPGNEITFMRVVNVSPSSEMGSMDE